MAAQGSTRGREAAREELRPSVRPDARNDQRSPMRLEPGQFLGRDGEVLTRGGFGNDEFEIPEALKEPGWSYQWVAATVRNKQNYGEMRDMMMNGWRPVKPHMLNGYFARQAQTEGTDHIKVGGLILMERPEAMTEAARADERRRADQQFGNYLKRVDTDANLPSGFSYDPRDNPRFRINRERREVVPDELKPRYKAQVVPAADE